VSQIGQYPKEGRAGTSIGGFACFQMPVNFPGDRVHTVIAVVSLRLAPSRCRTEFREMIRGKAGRRGLVPSLRDSLFFVYLCLPSTAVPGYSLYRP
jgi:hypothetical protein